MPYCKEMYLVDYQGAVSRNCGWIFYVFPLLIQWPAGLRLPSPALR